MKTLQELKEADEAPEFLNEESFKTLSEGYLLKDETPKQAYRRISNSAAYYLKKPELANVFFDLIWRNWLCPSSPICSNLGTERGLPISCFLQSVPDTTIGIFDKYKETAMLTKYGGGIGKYWGDIRPLGAPISRGGQSEGVIPWLKIEESVIQGVAQSGVRRGSSASYLPITHGDVEEFIDIRRPTGDLTRRCMSTNFHHAVTADDVFINEALNGNTKNRDLFSKVLKARVETGEPYLFFTDNANKNLSSDFIANNLKITQSNLCLEVFLPTDKKHTAVCCLSSLNLAKYDEWKNTDLVKYAIYFLDGVMEEFIQKASKLEGFEDAVRFSVKSRALGLGVLGWHTLLQNKNIAFDSFDAMQLNARIFKQLQNQSNLASLELAAELGIPEWCKSTGKRNLTCLAVAPTVSNSILSGGVSQGIEPIVANYYALKTAKGTFLRKNPALQKLLIDLNKDTFDVWEQINRDKGSVKNLKFLSDEQKEVFQTAREINQFAIVRQAGQRQQFIDQGQSTNLFFSAPSDISDSDLKKKLGKYIFDVHMEAWKLGVKGLYYCRQESVLKGDSVFKEASDCKSCEA